MINKFKKWLGLDTFEILLILGTILFVLAIFKAKKQFDYPDFSNVEKNNYLKPVINNDSFSEENLKNWMKDLNIEHANIVFNQARHETGNFTSNRFKKYNALFGFQITDTNIIKYKSWKESVIDYKCWQMKRLKPDENYYDFLIRIKYAKDSLYIKKLKKYAKS